MRIGGIATRGAERSYAHRSLFEKLGVTPEKRVALMGVGDAPFLAELELRLTRAPATKPVAQYDIVFVQVNAPGHLARIARGAQHLKADGVLWVFHAKGKGASPSEGEVRKAGLAAGLVDNKISAYTDTHTATRYVVPTASRASWKRRPG